MNIESANLFSYASKDAFWGGLKAAKRMIVFLSFHNFPTPMSEWRVMWYCQGAVEVITHLVQRKQVTSSGFNG